MPNLQEIDIECLIQEIRYLDIELAYRQGEIGRLKEKLAEAANNSCSKELTEFLDTFPIIGEIFKLHCEGKDRAEIAIAYC